LGLSTKRVSNRILQESEDRPSLRPEALADREHPLDEARSRRARGSKRALAPQDGFSEGALRGVVGRLQALDLGEGPEGGAVLAEVGDEGPRRSYGVVGVASQQPSQPPAQWHELPAEPEPRDLALPEAIPFLEDGLHDLLSADSEAPGLAAALFETPEVAEHMRPAELALPGVVRAAQAGRRGARTALHNHYLPLVRAFLFGRGARGADLQDAVQETFLRAMQAIHAKTVTPERFHGWIFTLARNAWADTLQRREKDRGTPRDPGPTTPAPDVLDDLALWEAVDALPEPYRETVLLSFREGLSGKEIAERLEISLDNVYARLFRAREMLRELLSDQP